MRFTGGMILTAENQSVSREAPPDASFFNTKSTSTTGNESGASALSFSIQPCQSSKIRQMFYPKLF